MPLELGIWRIDQTLHRIDFGQLDLESRLEDILEQDISVAAPNLMVIGRQVQTDYGKRIDLLAIDPDGTLVVLEPPPDDTKVGSYCRTTEKEARRYVARCTHAYSLSHLRDVESPCRLT